MKLTTEEQIRLNLMRKNLLKFKRLGWDVSTWNDAFTLDLIDRLMGRNK